MIGLLADINQDLKDTFQKAENFGPEFNVDDDEPQGVMIRIFSESLRKLQEALLEDYQAIDPDQASGIALDHIGKIFGSERSKDTFSTVPALASGIAGTDISEKLVRFGPSGELWKTPANSVIPIEETLALTLTAVDPGPVNAFASNEWEIINLTPGWNSIISIDDAVRGALAGTDAEYREQIRRELAALGKATAPAVVANLSQNVEGVSDVVIFPNRTNSYDQYGVAPHGMGLLVSGGKDEDIFAEMLRSIDISSETTGDIQGSTFVNGIEIVQRFSRPDLVPVNFLVEISTAGAEVPLPADAALTIQTEIKAYIDTFSSGKNVLAEAVKGKILAVMPDGSITGLDVKIGKFPDPPSFQILDVDITEEAITETNLIEVVIF